MDFDSSAKFISSLAKFLQSLCNGYVEFDNGVEVIGHIYLSVDTGKKIDYVLNEKVCKTDENSVTFISNSFHAQPAEKPKPLDKPKQIVPSEEDTDEVILMDDSSDHYSHSDNNQQGNSSPHPKSKRPLGASKRPFSHSYSSNRSSISKVPKYDSSNPNGAHVSSNNSVQDSSFNLDVSGNLTAASESDLSHLSQVFPETVNNSPITQDRDIKPVLDKELSVINVKEEYDPSADNSHGDGNMIYDEHGDDSYYSQDQSYDVGNDQYYGGGQTDPSQRLYGEAGPSGGSGTGDTQGSFGHGLDGQSQEVKKKRLRCPVRGCGVWSRPTVIRRHWQEKHVELLETVSCNLCSYAAKRKSHLLKHIRLVHKSVDCPETCIGDIVYTTNKQFIDPSPYTLETFLKLTSELSEPAEVMINENDFVYF